MWETIHFDFINKFLSKGLDYAHARVGREQWDKIHVDTKRNTNINNGLFVKGACKVRTGFARVDRLGAQELL